MTPPEPEHNPGVVTITLKDIWIQLATLRDQVAAIADQKHTVDDHENRLRSLERWKYSIPPAIITAIFSAVMTFLQYKP